VVGKIPDSAPLFKWQYLYIMTGSINLAWSLFLLFVMPDSPMNARFLTAEEKYHATKRLASNRTGIANKVWKWNQFFECFLDVRIWLIFFFDIVINIPNGGLQTFGSIIISNLGFGALEASLLTMPFGVVATTGAWIFSYIAVKWRNRRIATACIALILPVIGTAVVYAVPRYHTAAQMVGLYLMYFYWRRLPSLSYLGLPVLTKHPFFI
jgi:sugar phosphate permease